jgi:cob(I)alamin adenosyltransferase
MKIYTKTGDKGYTSLLSGEKVQKSHLRIEAVGTVDELNSYIGVLASYPSNESHQDLLLDIQHTLFNMGALLAVESSISFALPTLKAEDVAKLETAIDLLTAQLPALRHFILPGGHPEVAYCHIARTVCRRAERNVVRLSEISVVPEFCIQHLNRLSDYLFVLARMMCKNLGVEEVKWEKRRN